jgi:hypothetical protein
MSEVYISGNIGVLMASGGTVFFSKNNAAAGDIPVSNGTAPEVHKLQNALNVAYWGEDNRFPQNIEEQMRFCSIGKAALDWKARALYGTGIVAGKVTGHEKNGTVEIFQPIKRLDNVELYDYLKAPLTHRFWLEYLLDWTWFSNCFPEGILSNGGDKITHFVHQESCDCRYEQDDYAQPKNVFISKLWGASNNQYALFDPKKKIPGITRTLATLPEVDNKFVKKVPCIDMYDPVGSLNQLKERIKSKKEKTFIYPCNYPSPNKTYYQLPIWDGARLAGWIEIASKVPALLKTLYNKCFRIKYHIEIPETYFKEKFGIEKWKTMKQEEQDAAKVELLKKMDEYLSKEESAFATFVSYFQVNSHNSNEFGRIKITHIEDKLSVDKDLITSSAANVEILMAMQVHPSLFSAGSPGSVYRSGGGSGSDIREAFLVYNALLKLERQVAFAPLYLMRDFNGWDPELEFRVIDTQLTTLDKNTGTEKKLS